MPIERHRYPQNWESLSLQLKEQANWTCQNCGKVCRKQGESVPTFLNRNFVSGTPAWLDASAHPQKYCLTIAHLDQDPGNNSDENLLALCCPCHLTYDAQFKAANVYSRRERLGQLKLAIA